MDDLLNNDIMQGGDEALDIVKQESKNKNGQNEENKDILGDLKPPFRSASPMVLSGDNQTPKRREVKQEEKEKTSLQASLMKSLGAGFTGFMNRRKYSLDLDHKEKVRNQDLKNILTDKL